MREFPNAAPRPWAIHLVDETSIIGADSDDVATTCDSMKVERPDAYNNNYERMEANADLIVHAVNTYEQRERLLEEAAEVIRALNGFAVALERYSSKRTGGRRGGRVFEKALAFLAKLEARDA